MPKPQSIRPQATHVCPAASAQSLMLSPTSLLAQSACLELWPQLWARKPVFVNGKWYFVKVKINLLFVCLWEQGKHITCLQNKINWRFRLIFKKHFALLEHLCYKCTLAFD